MKDTEMSLVDIARYLLNLDNIIKDLLGQLEELRKENAELKEQIKGTDEMRKGETKND